jgi:hypothetical protein
LGGHPCIGGGSGISKGGGRKKGEEEKSASHGSRAFPWTPAQSVNKKTISISFLSDISLLTLAYYLNNLNMITSAENVSSNYFPFHFHFPSFSLPDMSMS